MVKLKEKVKSAPRELVRRGLDDGTERLRGQLRDTAQGGQADDYGGDRIEDTATSGARQAKRGVETLLKKRTGKGRTSDGEPHTTTDSPTVRKSPAEPPQKISMRIKTRETAAAREGGTSAAPPDISREEAIPAVGSERQRIKIRESAAYDLPAGREPMVQAAPEHPQIRTRGADAGASPVRTTVTEPSDRRSIKTKDAYIQSQPETYTDQPPQTIVQGQQGFTQEQGRKAAIKQAEARRTANEAVLAGRGSVRRQARSGSADTSSARETEKRIIRTARSVKKTPERTARHAIKTVERSSRKTIKTAKEI